ncbi:MAG: twin-arginine translocation signal domain-containing protein, partial [Methylococcales bacterium]|nr:twin-arginine translocation signal domain-containing protein [Methylococcales bacterium]
MTQTRRQFIKKSLSLGGAFLGSSLGMLKP